MHAERCVAAPDLQRREFEDLEPQAVDARRAPYGLGEQRLAGAGALAEARSACGAGPVAASASRGARSSPKAASTLSPAMLQGRPPCAVVRSATIAK